MKIGQGNKRKEQRIGKAGTSKKTASQRSNPKYGGLGGAQKVGKRRSPYRPKYPK